MKNLIAIFTGLILTISCTSLRKEQSKQKLATKQQLAIQQKELSTQVWQQNIHDSLTADYELAFWPKGIVKYSPANGFEGEASQIRLRNKAVKVTQLNENQKQQKVVLSQIDLKQQLQQVDKTTYKDKERNYFWVFGFLILLCLLIYMGSLLYRRRLIFVK